MIFRYKINESITIKEFLKKEKLPSNTITDIKERGQMLVNDQVVSNCYQMKSGDDLEIVFPATTPGENIKSVKGEFEIIYEDSYLLIINKPNNLATIPTRKHFNNSLANYIVSYYKQKGIVANIHFVSRLDAPTSGLIMVAKNSYLLTLLKEKIICKKYLLETKGIIIPQAGIIETGIIKDPHSIIKRKIVSTPINSKTIYQTIEMKNDTSIIEATLCTGKTHQLRLHFASLGYPIIGDELYGMKTEDQILHLHSYYLEFIHPITNKKMTFKNIPSWGNNKIT